MGDRLIRVFPRLWLRARFFADELPIHVRTQFFARHRAARGTLDGRTAFCGDTAMTLAPLVQKLRGDAQCPCKDGLVASLSGGVVGKIHSPMLSDPLDEVKRFAHGVFKQFAV